MNRDKENTYTDRSNLKPSEDSTLARNLSVDEGYVFKKFSEYDGEIKRYKDILTTCIGDLTELANKQNELESGQKETKELMRELKQDKHSLIGILTIFVAIFTFLSIELQILKSVTDYLRLAGLSIIILASLLFFVTNLHIIAEKWINNDCKLPKIWWTYNVLAVILLALGVLLMEFGDYKNPANIENDRNFIELKENTYKDKNIIDNIQKNIKNIENKIDKIKKEI